MNTRSRVLGAAVTAAVLATLVPMDALSDSNLPPDVPKVRFTVNPLYSQEGFRMGHLLQFTSVIGWHYEGSLMQGYASSPGPLVDQTCVQNMTKAGRATTTAEIESICAFDENPWHFSAVDGTLFKEIQGSDQPKPVVVYYSRPIWSALGAIANLAPQVMWSNTLNIAQKVWIVKPPDTMFKIYSLEQGELGHIAEVISHAEGYVEGRVVKATLDHLLRKTYEITIQLGDGGNNFKRMSVNDPAMFDHLVLAMMSGKLLRLGYVHYFQSVEGWYSDLRGYQTLYRITSVEVL